MSSKNEIAIRDATSADVESLASMVPRAFAPEHAMNYLFKDGPTMRQWWAEVYTCAIKDSTYRILVALDGSVVVGFLTLAFWRKTAALPEATGGLCTLVPMTDDHHQILKEALVVQVADRRKFVRDQTNFLVDLLGVDTAYQSRGIGRRLVELACQIADEEKAAIFLETSAAKEYYPKLRLGFEEMEQDAKDAETVIVRQPR